MASSELHDDGVMIQWRLTEIRGHAPRPTVRERSATLLWLEPELSS